MNTISKIAALGMWLVLALALPKTCFGKTLPEVLKEIQVKAEAGDATAQLKLGAMYLTGKGTIADPVKALSWFQKSAAQGNPEAQSYLCWMYTWCSKIPSNPTEAKKWGQSAVTGFTKAAEHGDALAQYKLSLAYEFGDGVTKNDQEAEKWLRAAADQGLALAQNALGVNYDMGRIVKEDTSEAVKWFRKAAEQGMRIDQFYLGCAYRDGRGVAQDSKKSVEWFLKSAEQGEVDSPKNVGVAYRDGKGVKSDPIEAMSWFLVGFSLDDREVPGFSSQDCIAKLEPTLSPEALHAAKKRSEEILKLIESNVAARIERSDFPVDTDGLGWSS